MRVLVIKNFDEYKSGMGQTILEMPEDVSEEQAEDYFVAWLRGQDYWKDKSKKECLEAEYSWSLDLTELPPKPLSKEEESAAEAQREKELALEEEERARKDFEEAKRRLEKATAKRKN